MSNRLKTPRTVLIAAASLAFLTVGCSSDPAYQVITGDANSVSYSWNADDTTLEEISKLAKSHCAQYGQGATLESDEASGDDNNQHTTIFNC
ncbi:MAG: hypothetical protein AAF530_01485 [Pseudomonadota bacterium]